ncbi:MAG: cyclic nucleotide-binding domain-containing protein [Magnetococcales bacterium]|nr:cyclic nucleotide-binding domain-containing protein [Magnetococcales bacterium]
MEFFAKFSPYEKKRICGHHASFESYPPGGRIIIAGSRDTSFFIIISGSVSVEKQRVGIIVLTAGEFFGEMAFLTNTPRTTDVVAMEKTLLLKISQELLDNLSSEIREKIKDRIIKVLVERLNKSTERLRVRM